MEHTVDPVAEFEAQRARLFGLAYRLLGSAQDAEDVVQEAFLRWRGVDRAAIITPSAWLAKVVTNLSLNRRTSAHATREQYIGSWLPEPLLVDEATLGPLETAEQRDSVTLAMLILAERLTPTERAVFVLREAFGYSHRDVAEILELTEANCRQLLRRAHDRIDADRPRFRPEPARQRELVERFLAATREGDVHGLEALLAADITSWADGGGKVGTARRPVLGAARNARYLIGAVAKGTDGLDVEIAIIEVNGEPMVAGFVNGMLLGLLGPQFTGDRISGLYIIANPDKLGFLDHQLRGLSHSGAVAGSSS